LARTVGAALAARLGNNVSLARALVEIDLTPGFGIVRMSSAEDVTFGGNIFTGSPIKIRRSDFQVAARSTASIEWSAFTPQVQQYVLSSDMKRAPVKIWLTESLPAFASDDAVLIFDGRVFGVSIRDGLAALECVDRLATEFAPRHVIGEMSGFTYFTPPGTYNFGMIIVTVKDRSR